MTHDWMKFDMARKIYRQLLEARVVQEKDERMIRGIIQIFLEENRSSSGK